MPLSYERPQPDRILTVRFRSATATVDQNLPAVSRNCLKPPISLTIASIAGVALLGKLIDGETAARRTLLRTLPKNGVGVEVGVWKGDFSALLLKETAPRTLHLIDPWLVSEDDDRTGEAWYGAGKITQQGMDDIYQNVAQRFSRQTKAGQIAIHRKASVEAMRTMPNESVDYVYIDGDHSYEGVSADLGEAFRITKNGGMICCDDYLLGSWWKDGVVRAVHEFLVAHPVVIYSKSNSQIIMRKRTTA